MRSSVRTKVQKKQSTSPKNTPEAILNPELEQSMMALESAVMRVLEKRYPRNSDDAELLTWQQRLVNIATPVSLALAEYKGPRRFHNHYRHREDDHTILHPVLEDPLEMLAHTCETALKHCHVDLAGMHEENLAKAAKRLETALTDFLGRYKKN